MRTPHLQGLRENLESGLDNRILKFRAAPHNNSYIACGVGTLLETISFAALSSPEVCA